MVVWEVDHFGFSDYSGIFGDVTGTLVIDPANPAASKVDVTIPVAKVTTASSGLTGHLLRAGKDGGKPDFFGPAPADAKFVSTRVVLGDDGDEAKVTGNLTLNGVTKPVTLDVDFHGAGTNPYNKKATVGFNADPEAMSNALSCLHKHLIKIRPSATPPNPLQLLRWSERYCR